LKEPTFVHLVYQRCCLKELNLENCVGDISPERIVVAGVGVIPPRVAVLRSSGRSRGAASCSRSQVLVWWKQQQRAISNEQEG
jgi:hypothetical protein